jgi:multidrug efflux system membrane fusion protein
LHVAIVTADNRIRMRPVKIARDLGTEVEIASGLSPSDRVVDSPPDSLIDGERVELQHAAAQTASDQ